MVADNECLKCNLCETPGVYSNSVEQNVVPCNVRAYRGDQFTVWRCGNCGSLHCKEAADLDHYYRDYCLRKQKFNVAYWCICRNRLRMFRRNGLKRTDRILDYGCGQAGLFHEYLRRKGYDARGYDRFVDEFNDPKILDQKFDVVMTFDVLEHDDDTHGLFQRLIDLTAPGGLLFIGTPRAEGLNLVKNRLPSFHMPYHRHILSEKILLEMGRKAGLEMVDITRRWIADTFYPAVNTRFIYEYVSQTGHELDVLMDPPRIGVGLTSPKLMFYFWYGRFFTSDDSMCVFFRKPLK